MHLSDLFSFAEPLLFFAQLTSRESFSDIEINLRAQRQHFYFLSVYCKTNSRNNLANVNCVRLWENFADLAHHLIEEIDEYG